MILRIKSNKVKYIVDMLNSEPILVKIENIKSVGDVMTVSTAMYIENDYITNGKKAGRGHLRDVNNNFTFDTSSEDIKHYSTNALKLIKDSIANTYELVDDDFDMLADVEWEDKETYPIRITFPTEEIYSNDTYSGLISMQKSKPRTIGFDYVTLYVPTILPEHRTFLDTDANILIEE